MADPGSSIPHYGVFGSSQNGDASNFVNDDLNSDFDDLFTFADDHMNSPLINPRLVSPGDIIGNMIIPFEGDSSMYNNFVNDPGLGSSSLPNYSENNGRQPETFQIPATTTSGNWHPRDIPHWPVPEVPFLCSCCQVLREIIHVNGGQHATKLEIHGRIGSICHAILENGQFGRNSKLPGSKYQIWDFCKKSLDNVKEFLQSYCNERKQAGYVLMPEPLSSFYQAVSVGMNWDEHMNTDDFFEPSPLGSSEDPFPANFFQAPSSSSEPFSSNFSQPAPPMIVHDPSQLSVGDPSPNVAFQSSQVIPDTTENGQMKLRTRKKKTPLSIQRVRTKKLFSPEFVKYFHLPIEEAAKKLDVCVTVVKQKCRDGNVKRWPYRKVRSCEKKITRLREKLIDASEDYSDKRQIESEIAAIQLEMANICGCPKCLAAVGR